MKNLFLLATFTFVYFITTAQLSPAGKPIFEGIQTVAHGGAALKILLLKREREAWKTMATAYFYLDKPLGILPLLPSVEIRTKNLRKK